jgi:sirohydrochlorin ferrochelatase
MAKMKTLHLIGLLFVSLFSLMNFCQAITSAKENGQMGVVVIAHGVPMPMMPMWNERVIRLVESVKSPYPVETAFLDYEKERTLEKAVKRLETKGVNEVLIIHLSPCSYSSHHEELYYLTGFRKDLGIYTQITGKPIQSTIKRFAISPCMDDHPLVTDILRQYAQELSKDPAGESLILLGHGPVEEVENIMWVRQLKRIGREIRKSLNFREIVCMTLRNDSADLIRDQAYEDLRETASRLAINSRVIVVVYSLGEGMLQEEVKRILKGVQVVVSTRGIVSHSNTVKWIEATIKNGMNQPKVPPINRKWSVMDRETGKPIGTHHYGLL